MHDLVTSRFEQACKYLLLVSSSHIFKSSEQGSSEDRAESCLFYL